MSDKLENCPFCGGDNLEEGTIGTETFEGNYVECLDCPLVQVSKGVWNQRATSSEKEAAICPHAAPFNYCQSCKVTPCPIGLDK